ncbi:MAG: terminase large subunit, partial [Candidatus Marinimicrobia bacterium]|nr:terminase large subunit [Candidatus Neomarinimicrobiota bacterium]
AATKADQARIPFNAARTMARMSPDLAKILNIGTHSIYDPDMGGIMKPISSDASYQDGLNPSEVNIDELHAHKTRNLIDVLETAVGAREQPLIDITTTAGNNQDTVCWDYHRYAENVLRGVFEDAGLFVYIASLDEGDKWTDPANYIKANPNLGVSVDMQNLLDEAEKAKNSPSRQDAFKQKKLNIWVQSADRWLDVDAWKKLAKPRAEKDLAGQAYCFGFDAAETVDFTAAVFLFEPDEDAGRKYPYLVPKFWLPEGALERRRDKRIRDQIKTWAREGWLTLTDGDVIDWDEVKLAVLEEAERFGAGIMPYDPYKAKQMAQAAQKVGIDAMLFRQGDVTMNEPCEEFERRILAGEIEHDGNPVLTWMIGNMVKKTGATGLIKPDRKKSTEKIDGGVGAIMALGAWMLEDDDEFYPDDYELMRVGNE